MKKMASQLEDADSRPEFVALGHLTADILSDGSNRPGGTVAYASVLARNLGQRAAIVTASSGPMRQALQQEGIQVRGPLSPYATTFENIYTPQGRVQYIKEVAATLGPSAVPVEWAGKRSPIKIVHLGPVAQEFVGPEILKLFPNALVGVTPQGWLRTWDNEGKVRPITWHPDRAKKVLRQADVLVLSIEDLPSGEIGQGLLTAYVQLTPLVVLTQGAKGCLVYQGTKVDHVPACPAQEVDPTGAGDIFAAAFFIKLYETKEPLLAARFAHAAAACHIEKPGLEGIPTRYEILQRLAALPD